MVSAIYSQGSMCHRILKICLARTQQNQHLDLRVWFPVLLQPAVASKLTACRSCGLEAGFSRGCPVSFRKREVSSNMLGDTHGASVSSWSLRLLLLIACVKPDWPSLRQSAVSKPSFSVPELRAAPVLQWNLEEGYARLQLTL